MRNDVLRNWKHLRSEVNSQWTHVTDDDLDRVDGRRQSLVSVLVDRYGLARECVEREIDKLVDEFETRLKKAS